MATLTKIISMSSRFYSLSSRLFATVPSRCTRLPVTHYSSTPLYFLPQALQLRCQYSTTHKVPSDNYRFTKSHEWISLDKNNDTATVGISDHAQDALGEAVYVELPDIDTDLAQGDVFGTVESVKAAADLYSPVGGQVCGVNENLNDSPSLVNEDPYTGGWIMKLKVESTEEYDQLMTPEEYEKFLEEGD